MSKDLIPGVGGLPANTTYIQEDHSNKFNISNSDVSFNVTFPQASAPADAEKMIAIQSFSREYYQLIVTCEEDIFQTQVVTVIANRALTKYNVPPEIFERCSSLSDAGIAELKTFPALICRENTELKGVTDPNQFAIYGYIRKVKVEGKNIKIVFAPLGAIPQSVLCNKKNAVYFDLNMDCAITDLNHSAWSVHKANLFEAFDEAGYSSLPRPVFREDT